jgi:hypothetical protein
MIKRWFFRAAIAVSFSVSLLILVAGCWAIVALQHGITELEESYAQQTQPQERNDR